MRAELFTGGNEGSVRVVHEIYQSLGLRQGENDLSIMVVGLPGRRGHGGEISGKSFVHIRRVHIGGFSPPVEKYFIMVAASWFSPRRRIMVPTGVLNQRG